VLLVDLRKLADLLPTETLSKPDSFNGPTVGYRLINHLARATRCPRTTRSPGRTNQRYGCIPGSNG